MDHAKMDKLSRAEFVKQECVDTVARALADFPVTIVPEGASGLPEKAPPDTVVKKGCPGTTPDTEPGGR